MRAGDGRLVAAAALAAAVAVPLAKRLWDRLARRKYGGLYGFVSWTSRLVAAGRAYESEHEDRLYYDPLGAALAGPEALSRTQEIARRPTVAVELDHQMNFIGLEPQAPGAKRKVGGLTIRTLYLDKAILDALQKAGGSPIQQVVLLGSGMDSRAWRLDLPAGTRWFEVDQEDVQRAKHGILRKAGAALSASEAAKVPLKVAEWHSMVANLLHQGWAQRLQQEGFDPSHPTLWLAEGLFNYLEPAGLKTMLSEAAQASAPGSVLLCDNINQGYWDAANEACSDARQADIGAMLDSMKQFVSTHMKWGCPDAPEQAKAFFSQVGWNVQRVDNIQAVARKVAGPHVEFAFNTEPPTRPDQMNYRFFTATPARH